MKTNDNNSMTDRIRTIELLDRHIRELKALTNTQKQCAGLPTGLEALYELPRWKRIILVLRKYPTRTQ